MTLCLDAYMHAIIFFLSILLTASIDLYHYQIIIIVYYVIIMLLLRIQFLLHVL